MENRQINNQYLVPLSVIAFLIPFFQAGESIGGLFLGLLSGLTIAFIGNFRFSDSVRKFCLIPLLGLFLVMTLSTFFVSSSLYLSIVDLLWWSVYLVVFLVTVSSSSTRVLKYFSILLVATASVLSLIGIYLFIQSDLSYLRLSSLWYQHNAFGGFLLAPLFLSLFFAFSEGSKKWWFVSSSAILLSALILTFSRGSILTFILVLVLASIVYYKELFSRKDIKKRFLISIILLAGSIVIVSGVFLLREYVLQKPQSDFYSIETISDNGATMRVRYWMDALNVIKENPIFGAGFGNYADVNRNTREVAGYFSIDPHNLYLKMIAELGVGSILFFIFIIYILVVILKKLYGDFKNGERASLLSFGSLGVIAILTHAFIDIDFMYRSNGLTFFLLAGLILGEASEKKEPIKGLKNILIGILVACFICSIFLVISNKYETEANYYVANSEFENGLSSLVLAEKFHIFKNASLSYRVASMYLNKFHLSEDDEEKRQMLEKAIYYMDQAIRQAPRSPSLIYNRALVYELQGDTLKQKEYLIKSINLNRSASYHPVVSLSGVYMKEKSWLEVVTLLERHIPVFERYLNTTASISDPNKEKIFDSVVNMYFRLRLAYENIGDTGGSKKTQARMDSFMKGH